MNQIRGAVRATLVILVIVGGTLIILLAALLRLRYKGIPLANWIPVYMARATATIFNVRLHCTDPDRLRTHQGFILPNHLSFVDIVVVLAMMPLRFLSAQEVKNRPMIGWAASAMGTVFVDRSSMQSRRAALVGIADSYAAAPDPPILIFPEGRLGTGTELSRFQLGIFKLARTHAIRYLPVAIAYDNPEIAIWRGRVGETLFDAGWKLATYRGPLRVTLTPLTPVLPRPEDNAAGTCRRGPR